jgi:hypothetical protein
MYCNYFYYFYSTPFRKTEKSTIVVRKEQKLSSDHGCRSSLSNANQNESDVNDNHSKIFSKSLEHVFPETIIVLVAYENAFYQDGLHHNPSVNGNIDEWHGRVVTKNESIDKKKQSFIYELSKQIELKLLKDSIFALFALSNFLTSLGFDVPYTFANDLAIDENIIENRRHWIIMSIGAVSCFGRLIIGILGDRKWLYILYFSTNK